MALICLFFFLVVPLCFFSFVHIQKHNKHAGGPMCFAPEMRRNRHFHRSSSFIPVQIGIFTGRPFGGGA